MADLIRLYVVTDHNYDPAVDIVTATSAGRARASADLECDYIDRRVRLFRHKGEPVVVAAHAFPWENAELAPILRDEGYCWGEPGGARCEACGLDSFEGWGKAPPNWAVCVECDRCVDCAADEFMRDSDLDEVCGECREVVANHRGEVADGREP